MPRPPAKSTEAPKPRFQRRQSIDSRLLEGMEKLIAQGENFSTVSVERLAEVAGIGRATFYKHFRDKAELVTHLFAQVRKEIVSSAGVWFEDASTTTRTDMARALRGIVGVYRQHHVILSAMSQLAGNNEDVAQLARQMHEELCQQSRKAVKQLRQARRAHPDADDVVADILTLAIDHCSTQHPDMLEGRGFERVIAAWTHIAWNALAAPERDG